VFCDYRRVKIQDNYGYLPIHCALWGEASYTVIKMLLEAYPMAAKKQTDSGYLPLHIATRVNMSEDILLMLVDAYPESITMESRLGFCPVDFYEAGNPRILRLLTPLEENKRIAFVCQLQQAEDNKKNGSLIFEAVEKNASYDEIKAILQKHPEAIYEKDKDGCLPLHKSLLHGTSEDIIMLLFEFYPKAARVRANYRHGELPIHDALMSDRSINLIQLLLDAYPLAAEKKLYDDSLALYIALQNTSDTIIRMIFEAYPQAVEFPTSCVDNGYLLHWALNNHASNYTIKMLLKAYPKASEYPDECDRLPLHIAVRCGASSDIIVMLLKAYPKGAQIQDYQGDLPLHCVPWAVLSTELFNQLLKAYTNAAKIKNKQGKIPLHCACKRYFNKTSLMSVDLLISAYPEAINVKDNDGFSPPHYLSYYLQYIDNYRHKNNRFLLHMAIRNNCSKHLVTLLVRGFPHLCLKRDKHGKIPLHYACEGKTANFVFYIMTLLDSSPDSLHVEDRQRRTPRQVLSNTLSLADENKMLPLHHLAASSASLSVESLQLFVNVYPESIATEDNRGMLPTHYACLNQTLSLDVLMLFLKLYPEAIKNFIGL
jgi:ankyrin repeat protein